MSYKCITFNQSVSILFIFLFVLTTSLFQVQAETGSDLPPIKEPVEQVENQTDSLSTSAVSPETSQELNFFQLLEIVLLNTL